MSTDKQTNARLLRIYGITLAEYNKMSEKQHHKCAICGRPETGRRLAVDHLHFPKIETGGLKGPDLKYYARTTIGKQTYVSYGKTKKDTLDRLKSMIRKYLVRGLLDSSCNRVLGKVENPRWKWRPKELRAAADYLERFENGENRK